MSCNNPSEHSFGKASGTQHMRFKTRLYKHEVKIRHADRRNVAHYTDRMWEALCRQVVRHGFNGLVLYPDAYHPFEFILDYKDFPQAVSVPASHRKSVRKSLCRGLEIARSYGLTTFMQHYVAHFTESLAKAYGIPTTGRLSDITHPAVDRYCRYCYREIFRQLPDLDGLYFNFESAPNAGEHVMKTAMVEFNRMKRKPVAVYRLWNFNSVQDMRKLLDSYKGRAILAHKIADTNDAYYLPVADSRVAEWKKALGNVEFMFLIGPCHNCGTNLCEQLWGDYEFIQEFLRDAESKGADSIAFHSAYEFFSHEMRAKGVFPKNERSLARYNFLHLQAVSDFFVGRKLTGTRQGELLACRTGVSPNAGATLRETVKASSQLILLIYQQFCHSSAFEGYLNPGRFSHIQEPFMFFPATELNDQAGGPVWTSPYGKAWLGKTMDTQIAPDNFLQYIIDYVDPSKPIARRNPKKLADMLGRNVEISRVSLGNYRRLVGRKVADELETYLERNAALGKYVQGEILAAVHLYGVYFAASKTVVISALRKGLSELERIAPLVAERNSPTVRSMERATIMFAGYGYRLSPLPLIESVRECLELCERPDWPMKAYAEYPESRRIYNEIRRTVRPIREHGARVLTHARKLLRASARAAERSLSSLAAPQHQDLAANVRLWRQYVENELARTVPPAAICPDRPIGTFLPLQHDHCFRAGYNFVYDFIGFFRPIDYLRASDLSFQTWRTGKALVVEVRERGVDPERRKAAWRECRGSGDDSWVTRIYVETGETGERHSFIIWPEGRSVSMDRKPDVKVRADFSWNDDGWQVRVTVPFALLGRRPRRRDLWRLNVTANPAVRSESAYTWAPQYDAINPLLWGELRFR